MLLERLELLCDLSLRVERLGRQGRRLVERSLGRVVVLCELE